MKTGRVTINAIVTIIMCFFLLIFLIGGCQQSSPGIVGTNPANGATAVTTSPATIQISFDQPMDRSSVEKAFSISPAVDQVPAFAWSDNDRTLVVTYPQPLQPNTSYTVSLGTGAKATSAIAVSQDQTFTFKTAPTAVAGTAAQPSPATTTAPATPEVATTPVDTTPPPSFAKDIQPIAKTACDGCHSGQATGKMSDYDNIIAKKFVVATDPDNSPYYRKGSGLVTHSGGDAWKANKQLVRDWIAAGAPK